MSSPAEWSVELHELLRAARAHLEVETELGIEGLPSLQLAPDPVPSATIVSARSAAASAADQHAQAHASAELVAPAAVPSTPAVVLEPDERRRRLELLATEAAACTACVLHEKRNKSVFARGSEQSELVFVGEGPGRDEDQQGLPFVGAAGQLLDRMIVAMGYARDEVYICNVVKCRPPENRTPKPDEMIACNRYLTPQVQLIAPKVIVALGRCAAQALGAAEATGSWRGRWSSWQGIPVLPTYHPAFLLRSPEYKRTVWEDLQLVMQRLGKVPPKRS